MKLRLDRTLGPQVVSWIEANLVHGPGDVQGQSVQLDDEQVRFLLRAYEIDSQGKRVIRRAVFSRPKGRAKSELAAMVVCAEALGPVRFRGWAEDGRPLGGPVQSPIILCAATEEGQADNAYAAAEFMLREGPVSSTAGLDVGMTRTYTPGGGKIVPITARASSKDGGRETFVVFDEALALDTPLPTPTGWTTMGHVQVGDHLFGSDGNPVAVIKTTPVVEKRDCFRVTLEDGTRVTASSGHLWQSMVSGSAALPRVRTTGEMFADGRTFRVPTGAPAETMPAALPIDPYVLGLWLGDGDARNATITVGEADTAEFASNVAATGYIATWCGVKERAPLAYVSTPMAGKGRHGTGLKPQLRSQGLLGAKRIPNEYLRASVEQRTSLLQGLMDSDGHVSPRGNCTFTNTSDVIAASVAELLRSLGEVCTVRWYVDDRARSGGCFKVHFTPRRVMPFRLERKMVRVRGHSRGAAWMTVKTIEPVDPVPVRCVAVDAPDHLFRAGSGWTITHNTHLYTTPELHRLHSTIRRNLAKRRAAEPWSLEVSTMYAPGEGSVAENSHNYAKSVRAGQLKDASFLFDHRQGPADFDFKDDGRLRSALLDAYGDAAEWMDIERLIAEARDPQTLESDFRRYFLNQPTERFEGKWISGEQWDACFSDEGIPALAPIVVAVDAALKYDTTAVAWAARREDGRIAVQARVWSARPDVPHTDGCFVAGGRIDNELVERFIIDNLANTYRVQEVVYDPRYFDSQAQNLSEAGLVVAEFPQQSALMADAYQHFYEAVGDRWIAHDGDPVLRQHVEAAAAKETERGWKVWKLKSSQPIDALVASVMARERAAQAETNVYEEHDLLLL